MKYQISCDMTFDNSADRDSVHSFLEDKSNLAFQLPGDILISENAVTGGFRVSSIFRVDQSTDMDEIYSYLQFMSDSSAPGSHGFIEKHLCGHDQGVPCTGQVSEIWGDAGV